MKLETYGQLHEIARATLEEWIEEKLTSLGGMQYNHHITFSLLPETIKVYVGERAKAETTHEGRVLLRTNGKKKEKA